MQQRGAAVAAALGAVVLVVLLLVDLPAGTVVTDGTDAHRTTAHLTTGTPDQAAALSRDILDRANAERTRRGLYPLEWDDELAARAGAWSTRMTTQGFVHSDGPYRATARYPATGENIALGQLDTRELHVGWMRSDGHRANLLAYEAVALGVGIVCRGDGTMWATQIFGFATADQPPPVLPPPDWDDQQPAEPIVGTDRGVRCPLDARG